MTTLITTWIMWAIIGTTNPNVNSFVVVEEYKDKEECIKIAKSVSIESAKEFARRKMVAITKVTTVCIPVVTRK